MGGIAWYGNRPTLPFAGPPFFGDFAAIQSAVYDPANQALYFSGLRVTDVGVLNATSLAPIWQFRAPEGGWLCRWMPPLNSCSSPGTGTTP
ncbi:MAG: hypothetical protein L3K01_05405 [Thermoplasmata archaeon]|nr:hypothetical protein [Thermoplasmata archaeon]